MQVKEFEDSDGPGGLGGPYGPYGPSHANDHGINSFGARSLGRTALI